MVKTTFINQGGPSKVFVNSDVVLFHDLEFI